MENIDHIVNALIPVKKDYHTNVLVLDVLLIVVVIIIIMKVVIQIVLSLFQVIK